MTSITNVAWIIYGLIILLIGVPLLLAAFRFALTV